MEVRKNGSKWWRFKYRYGGKEKLLSMGTYPDTSLKLAREKRDIARAELAAGIDPSSKRKAQKKAAQEAAEVQENSFRAVAEQWLHINGDLKPTTIRQLERGLEKYVYPSIGSAPIHEVRAPDLLHMLRRIESTGIHETAHRVRSLVSRIFRFAIATGKAERDPAADLAGALTRVKKQHFAAITNPERIGELLRAINGYQGQPSVMYALKLAPLVFVRPGELRSAEWQEIDLQRREWRIPTRRMKGGAEHLVPLAKQVIFILKELHEITGHAIYLFPSITIR